MTCYTPSLYINVSPVFLAAVMDSTAFSNPFLEKQMSNDSGSSMEGENEPSYEAKSIEETNAEAQAAARRSRKGKRNKPTLNCSECVDRKTKCDRARPTCLSCLRRETICQYTRVADILAATGGSRPRKRSSQTGPRPKPPSFSAASGNMAFGLPNHPPVPETSYTVPALYNTDSQLRTTTSQSSSVQRVKFTLFPPYENKQHPFGNYWTCVGGLSEVVGVLPSKDQADILVEKYFECVDPLYPIVSRPEFTAEYERFWNLPLAEKCESDPGHIALQFIIYASGQQYMDNLLPDEKVSTSEFYVSACHQALCLFSYLNRCSLPTMQTMILICYFLISNNHISDAWTFSGMTQRQAYGLALNRNPDIFRPEDSFQEKQQRCRLWQATMFQDTSLSLYTELPPATSYHDIDPTCLRCSDGTPRDLQQSPGSVDHMEGLTPFTELSVGSSHGDPRVNDISFLRALWEYASFAQAHFCIPRALRRALCRDSAHKLQLIAEFRKLYSSWAPPFNSYDPSRFEGWDSRLMRQTIAVSSNFFWLLMFVYMDKNELTGVESDIYGALEASHEGLAAFFALVRLVPSQADAWCAHHTRAYEQATMIGTILATHGLNRDPRRMLAKSDFERYIDILIRARGAIDFEMIRQKRLAELEALRIAIKYI